MVLIVAEYYSENTTRELPTQKELDNVEAMLSKRFFQSCRTDFHLVIVCFADNQAA